jgi:hypothetical protein
MSGSEGCRVPSLRVLCARALEHVLKQPPHALSTMPHLVAHLVSSPPSLLDEALPESKQLSAPLRHLAAMHLLHPPAASGGTAGDSFGGSRSDAGVGGTSRDTNAGFVGHCFFFFFFFFFF